MNATPRAADNTKANNPPKKPNARERPESFLLIAIISLDDSL